MLVSPSILLTPLSAYIRRIERIPGGLCRW
ncbi:hypothetical protein HQQ82_02150 [Rathayibacter sp. VKM Ac-2856]|nr:hypothetical protein [Rathayibacter sp. VKM Ac-2858]NQX18764.1 hypothetical protein [Rathayibacter sp. VKM Ac-2856]